MRELDRAETAALRILLARIIHEPLLRYSTNRIDLPQ